MRAELEEPSEIRVLILDSSAVFRAGLRSLLDLEDGFTVIGEVDRSREATALIRAERPNIVLFGANQHDVDAESTLVHLLDAAPETHVIVLGDNNDQRTLRQLIARGARAYLPKSVSIRHLVSVMWIVHADHRNIALSPSISPSPARSSHGQHNMLSHRELEVIALVSQAMSNVQIARRLDITEGTVKRHLRSVFTKLHAVSRLDAVNRAVEAGIIPPPVGDIRRFPTSSTRAG